MLIAWACATVVRGIGEPPDPMQALGALGAGCPSPAGRRRCPITGSSAWPVRWSRPEWRGPRAAACIRSRSSASRRA